MSAPTPRRILFISLAGAGDTLLATPLMREVHLAFPEARIEALTMQGAAPRQVLADNPAVAETLHQDFLAAGRRRAVLYCFRLRRRRYDLSFTVMPQNRLEYNLITWLIGARQRLGFEFVQDCGAQPRRWLTRVVQEDRSLHVVDNNLRLLTEGLRLPLRDADPRPRLYLQPEHEAWASAWIEDVARRGRTWIGFHPGSGTTKNLILKRWPVAHWAVLARRLCEDPSVRIALFGSRDELPLRASVLEAAGLPTGRIEIAPDESVRHTAALIRRMACFICGDTLLTHVAAAVGAPTVVVCGPTDPTATGPYRTRRKIVRLGLSCSPCYFFSKHGIRCTHHRPMACLQDLGPEAVAAAARDLIDSGMGDGADGRNL